MSSTVFDFDIKKLQDFSSGDVDIAQKLHEATQKIITSFIKDEEQKQLFIKLNKPNKKSGFFAMEKTAISSMMESQKPFVDIIKICLELFGEIDVVVKKLIGGSNPLNDTTSLISTHKKNNNITEEQIVYPLTLFLGKLKINKGTTNLINSIPQSNEFNINVTELPIYKSFTEYEEYQLSILNDSFKDLTEEEKNLIINDRKELIIEELEELKNNNQINKILQNFDIALPLKDININYNNKDIKINLEQDYKISINNYVESNESYINIIATLKENLQSNTGNNTTQKPDNYSGGDLVGATTYFFSKVIKIITEKLMPLLKSIGKIISDPFKFITDIISNKLKEHFELFDLSKTKLKYKEKFVIDGETNIDVGILKMYGKIEKGKISFEPGNKEIKKEQSLLKMIMNFMALQLNFIKMLFDFFKDLVKKLSKVKELPNLFTDFFTFELIKKMLSKDNILLMLGAVDGDITKIPFFSLPKDNPNKIGVDEMKKQFIKMITDLINQFITLPNTLINKEVIPKIEF